MESSVIVRLGLDILKPHLHSFAEQQLRKAYGNAYISREPRLASAHPPDVQALFRIYLEHWGPVFSTILTPADRSLIFELKDVRNLWAHERRISLDEAYRALDSVERLLGSLGGNGESERLTALKHDIRLQQVGLAGTGADAPTPHPAGKPHAPASRSAGRKGAELRGRTLRITPGVLKEGNPRVPYTHGWLAFEVLRRADSGTLSFAQYRQRLFNPDPEIEELAKAIPGVPNAYQDLKHIRHDIAKGRVYVE
jgi:hypothetical protein